MTIGQYPPIVYTPQEQERIAQFRKRIGDLELTDEQQLDAHLIRWLRARNLDVDKACEMLKKSQIWRAENKIDGILEREDVPEEIKKQTPFANCGVDKEGHPILIVPMGRHDGRTMLENYGADRCFRYNTINCEKIMSLMKNLSEEQGRPVTSVVEIIDLEGYNYRQLTSKACRDFVIKMQTTLDANYPELLHYCCVINAPKIFNILFSILKPFIPKQTLEKVDIFGPEPEKWKKVIAEKFPLELIPPRWGGTRQGCDEFCSKDNIWLQGPLNVAFFSPNGVSLSDEDSQMVATTINARDILKIKLDVKKYNSSITWRFRSQEHDIGFSIEGANGQVLMPFQRVQSQKQLQEGTLVCEELGQYTVIFDNTYSYTRSKSIFYQLEVIEPEEENSNYQSQSPSREKREIM